MLQPFAHIDRPPVHCMPCTGATVCVYEPNDVQATALSGDVSGRPTLASRRLSITSLAEGAFRNSHAAASYDPMAAARWRQVEPYASCCSG